jgi:hypothetical protein
MTIDIIPGPCSGGELGLAILIRNPGTELMVASLSLRQAILTYIKIRVKSDWQGDFDLGVLKLRARGCFLIGETKWA